MLDELKKIGLSENEAKTYLALLELGSATVQQIAQKSGIKRVTTYVQLETLMKMGLISSFEKSPERKNGAAKTFFRAEDPENLKKIVEREKKLSVSREKTLQDALPQLENIFSLSGERPRVRFFEGTEGIKTMQEEFLKRDAREIIGASSFDDVLRIFPKHLEEFSPRRAGRGITARLIYTSSQGAILKNVEKPLSLETAYLPAEKFPFSCDISVIGNTIAILALKNQIFGIAIENKDIADSMRAFFNLAWEEANRMKT